MEKNNLEEEKKNLEKRLKEIKEEQRKNATKKIKSRLLHNSSKKEKEEIPTSEANYYTYSNQKDNRHKNNNVSLSLVFVITIIVAVLSGLIGAAIVLKFNTVTTTTNGVTTSSVKLDETNTISESVDKVYDAVVVVEGYSKNELISTGTGFVYKKDNGKAYIMTNHHVVSDCDSVKLLFTNGDEIDAELEGSDTYSDIAVLSVKDSDEIKAAIMGDSSKTEVGDTVFTVGSPEGADYAGTVTKGILSGKDRLVAVALTNSTTSDYYMKVLQTDAAINPGNSGGPICNINGEVIGITNMKLVDATVEGMGFAIPIEDALYYAAILEKGENIERPYFGISMLDITDSYYLWQNGINIPEKVTEGVVVIKASKNSPADKEKKKKGDIIIKLADEDISSLAEFRYELYKHKVGEKVSVTYIRDNKEKETEVTLEKNND